MNLRRLMAVMVKELRQMRRDRITFGMMLGVPLIQLVLFGFAIVGIVESPLEKYEKESGNNA